ncbi:MAG: DUF2231 domain-containing protein [Verrucomicrobiota bacterium]|jgi:uncharacterized membrane protein
MRMLKGEWLGHPLHPIFVHIPVALWPISTVCDLLSLLEAGSNLLVRLAFFCVLFALLVGALAIPTGLVDWSGIKKEKPAWKIGLYHLSLNLTVWLMFAISLGLRIPTFWHASKVESAPLWLGIAANLVLMISTYLGGLMVFDHGISVARHSKHYWRKQAEAGQANVPPEKTK